METATKNKKNKAPAVIMMAPGELRASKTNARTHSTTQINMLARSMAEFGFMGTVLITDDNTIIAGHGRVAAALQLSMEAVPCIKHDHLSPEQIRAYVLADNKLAEAAGWDMALLTRESMELSELGIDLTVAGFGQDEIESLLSEAFGGDIDENETVDEIKETTTTAGDVWVMGDHRLVCGDCCDPEIVQRVLQGEKPHLMVTDPPYGVNYDPAWREKLKPGKFQYATGKVLNDNRADWSAAYKLFPGDVAYVWHAATFCDVVFNTLIACDFEVRAQIIWAKNQLVISRGHYHSQHEPCFYAVKRGKTAHWNGSRKKSTLWKNIADITREGENVYIKKLDAEVIGIVSEDMSTVWNIPKPLKSETGHGTQKPVECMRRPIFNNSKLCESVYEPFCGSGTTIISAEQTRRRCYAIELSPVYVEMSVRRWERFTGNKAIHHKSV